MVRSQELSLTDVEAIAKKKVRTESRARLGVSSGERVLGARPARHSEWPASRSNIVRIRTINPSPLFSSPQASLRDQMARMTAERRAAQDEAAVLQRQLALALDAVSGR
jgi:hypothetical protein